MQIKMKQKKAIKDKIIPKLYDYIWNVGSKINIEIKEVDKDNDVVEVDTLTDLLELLAKQNVKVRISDTSELRHMDIEESFDEDEE